MKVKSEAYKKAESIRDSLHQGAVKITAKDLSSVCYLYSDCLGHLCAKGYRGRAVKPSIYHYYSSESARVEKVQQWMKSVSERAGRREASERLLAVGDVLRSLWGYEQTNVDYYVVTKLVGKSMVEIAKIGCKSAETLYMQGYSIPNPKNIIGEPMRKKAKGEAVKLSSFQVASKMHPKKVAGVEVYDATHWTAYA